MPTWTCSPPQDARWRTTRSAICDLGSGIMPFRALRDRGIAIAIGTDERAADDTVNSWAALKQAGCDPRDHYTLWPTPSELLHAATSAGARGMRIDHPGHMRRAASPTTS